MVDCEGVRYHAVNFLARARGMQFDQLKRRELITLLGGAAATWPLAARAQQPATLVIGFLSGRSPAETKVVDAFRKGLGETGYAEHKNLSIEYRWAEGRYDQLPALAADLVGRRAAVIVASGGLPAPLAAKAATTTIPIVFAIGVDPVVAGLVASLNRPGGNLTGVTNLNTELVPKRLELLHVLLPSATIVAALLNPTNPNGEAQSRDLQVAARTLGLQMRILHASTERDFDMVFTNLMQQRAGALVIGTDGFFLSRSEQLAALSVRYAVPAIFQYPEFTTAGGLMSYGGSDTDMYQLAGRYTGRILQGEKPSDLPVQQSTKVELIINLRTARLLGINVPLSLLGRADEVIE
jgi:putative tryptophan/tyrosine transport system substrate-binding protein